MVTPPVRLASMPENISAHFTLTEVTASETADNLHIPNDLPQSLFDKAQALAEHILEPIRSNFGVPFSPRSWYRSPTSKPPYRWLKEQPAHAGRGRRYTPAWPSHISNLTPGQDGLDNLSFDQLILEFYDPANPKKGWVHCSYSLERRRGQCLTAFSVPGLLGKRKTIYAPGLLVQLPKRYQRTFSDKRKIKKAIKERKR